MAALESPPQPLSVVKQFNDPELIRQLNETNSVVLNIDLSDTDFRFYYGTSIRYMNVTFRGAV